MCMTLLGALTIGTLDGANVEICQEVGEANIFIFGLTAEEIAAHHRDGTYHPQDLYRRRSGVRRLMDTFTFDRFCRHEPGLFHWIYQAILHGGDPYFLLVNFESYVAAHDRLAEEYTDAPIWLRKSILNVARAGKFSSDRTITEYARDI